MQSLLDTLPPFLTGSDMLKTPLPIQAQETRDDMSLCFLCMRWSAADPDCRAGKRCTYQGMLDELEHVPCS